MAAISDNQTLSCLIMDQNVKVLKKFLEQIERSNSNCSLKTLKVDGVEFEYSSYGLWIRSQIPLENQNNFTTNTIQKESINHNKSLVSNQLHHQMQLRESKFKQQLNSRDQQIEKLNMIILNCEQKIRQYESQISLNSVQNQKIQSKTNTKKQQDKQISKIKKSKNKNKGKQFYDGDLMVQVDYCYDVSVQTQQTQDLIHQLQSRIQVLEAQIQSKDKSEQIIIEEQITLADVIIQTSITMSQMRSIMNQDSPEIKKIPPKPKKQSAMPDLNSEERRNFHKKGMIESEKKNNLSKKMNAKPEQRVRIVDRIVEVQKVIQKIVEVPVDRVVQLLRERIVQVPVQVEKIVQRIVQIPGKEIIKEVPVERIVQIEKIVEKIVDKIVEIEKPIEIQKIVEVQKQVIVIKEIEKIVEVQKLVEIEKIVQKIVEVVKIQRVQIEKIVQVQKIEKAPEIVEVEKEVLKIVQVQVPVEKKVNHLIQLPVEIKIIEPQPYPVETLVIVEVEVQKNHQAMTYSPHKSLSTQFVKQELVQQQFIENLRETQIMNELVNKLNQATSRYQEACVQNANNKVQILFYQKELQKYQIIIAETEQHLEDNKRQSRDLATQCDRQINQFMQQKDKLLNQIQNLRQSKNKMEQNYHNEKQKRAAESLSQQKDMDSLLEQLNQLKEYIDSLKSQIIDSEEKMTQIAEQKTKAIYDLEALEEDYQKLQEEYRTLEKDTEGLYSEFKQRQQQIDSLIEQHQMQQSEGKRNFEDHMRNLIEKYQELEDKNKFKVLELERYVSQYNEISSLLVQMTKQRDILYDRLVEIDERLPTNRSSSLDQDVELLQALQQARKQIIELKQQVFRLQSLQKQSMIGKHDEQVVYLKQMLSQNPNNKQLVDKLLHVADQSIYDYKKLQNHCEKLREIVVEYQLKMQQPNESEDHQQLKQLLQRVVDQLQKQRYQKDMLQQDIQKMVSTLYQYEQALIQKQQQINYFRIKMTQRNRNKKMMKYSKSNDNLLRNGRHDFSVRQYVIDDLSYRQKQRKMNNITAFNKKKLSNEQITVFKNGYQNGILNKNKSENDQSRSIYNTSIQMQNMNESLGDRQPSKVSLKLLMETGYISKLSMLTIMLKLAEKAQDQLKNQSLYLTTQCVTVSNFKELSPESMQVQFQNTHNHNSLYSSPQLLNGKDYSEASAVWNLGMIFDEMMHKKLFYSSTKDIMNPEDNYKFKSISMSDLRKTITKALLKTPEQRISLSNLIFSLSLEIRKIRG